MQTIKNHLPEPIRELGFNILSYFQLRRWEKSGRPVPPPNKVKQDVVSTYGEKYSTKTLVETGTYLGNMIFAQRKKFSQIHSIELAEVFYEDAVKRFKNHSHITIHRGNSAEVLPELIQKIDEPALFWLDGHFSGGETAESFCPVMDELESILKSNFSHVILIDDARCFNGEDNYPSIPEIEAKLKSKTHSYDLKVAHDIIRITYDL